ncbi:MAG: hypothetical protein ACRD3Q_21235 [Terriglobales bacterium]
MSEFTEGFTGNGNIFTPSGSSSGPRGRFGGFTGRARGAAKGWTEKNRPGGFIQDAAGNVHVNMESRLDQAARSAQSAYGIVAAVLPLAAACLVGISRVRQRSKANKATKKLQAQQLKIQKAHLKAVQRSLKAETHAANKPSQVPNQVVDTDADTMFGLTPRELLDLREQFAQLDHSGAARRNAAHMPVSGAPARSAIRVGH